MIKMATGNEPPADAKWDMKATKWDAQTTDKAEIRKILEKSFAQVHQAIAAFADADLDKKVNFFFWTRGDRPLGPSDASRPYRRTPRAGDRLRPEQQGDAALEQGGEIAAGRSSDRLPQDRPMAGYQVFASLPACKKVTCHFLVLDICLSSLAR
jgi:hypothetical protein